MLETSLDQYDEPVMIDGIGYANTMSTLTLLSKIGDLGPNSVISAGHPWYRRTALYGWCAPPFSACLTVWMVC